MNTIDEIKITMLENKNKYCEFATCLISHGQSNIICNKTTENDFYFLRDFGDLGFTDLFISCNSEGYLYKVLHKMVKKNTTTVSILYKDKNNSEALLNSSKLIEYCHQNNLDIKMRYQFYKNKNDIIYNDCNILKLNHTHKLIIEKSESDMVKKYYDFSIHNFGESYGIVENNLLVSYLSVPPIINSGFLSAEINWIYTESPFKNKNYATKLLVNVCDILIKKGITATYHCDSNNIASKKLALKARMQQEQAIIILERPTIKSQ